jgi:mRNA interferase RelE/StbE
MLPGKKADWLVKFRIFETEQFSEDLATVVGSHGGRLREKLLEYVYPQLRNNPFFGKNIKKLKNYRPATWRYRIGRYRFFYEVDAIEHIVYMLVVESRRDSYR